MALTALPSFGLGVLSAMFLPPCVTVGFIAVMLIVYGALSLTACGCGCNLMP